MIVGSLSNAWSHIATDMNSGSSLGTLRERIDRIDEELVRLLADRFGLTNEIGQFKKAQQLCPVDEERERQQFKRVRQLAVEAGLNPDFADRFLRCVIDEVVQNHNKL